MVSKNYFLSYFIILLFGISFHVFSSDLEMFCFESDNFEENLDDITLINYDDDNINYFVDVMNDDVDNSKIKQNKSMTAHKKKITEAYNHPSVIALTPAIIEKKSTTSSIKPPSINFLPEEREFCNAQKRKVLDETGDMNLAKKAYKKTYNNMYQLHPEYKEYKNNKSKKEYNNNKSKKVKKVRSNPTTRLVGLSKESLIKVWYHPSVLALTPEMIQKKENQ